MESASHGAVAGRPVWYSSSSSMGMEPKENIKPRTQPSPPGSARCRRTKKGVSQACHNQLTLHGDSTIFLDGGLCTPVVSESSSSLSDMEGPRLAEISPVSVPSGRGC